VASAAVALMLSRPMADTPIPNTPQNPDWVKYALKYSAQNTSSVQVSTEGQGRMCLSCAVNYFPKSVSQAVGASVGGGSLDATRGALDDSEYIWDGTIQGQQAIIAGACTPGNYYYVNWPALCVPAQNALLKGNKDIFGNSIDPVNLAGREKVDPKTGTLSNGTGAWSVRNGVDTWNNGSFPVGVGLQSDPVLGLAVPAVDWNSSPLTDHTYSGAKTADTIFAATNFDSVKWRDGTWSSVKWRDGSWESVKWRDGSWESVKWRADAWDSVKWHVVKWRDAAFKAASWS
jgi:hypothetical protein